MLSFLRYRFETFQVDNTSRSRITQLYRPHKNCEDNYEERGFWDPNSRNLSQQKNIFAYSSNYRNFAESPHEHLHIVNILTRF